MGRFLFCSILFYVLVNVLGESSLFFKRLNRRLLGMNFGEEHTTTSEMQCILWCINDTNCEILSWHPISKLCQLPSSVLFIHDPLFETVYGWITYEKSKYEVSMYYKDDKERDMDFQEAVARCVAMGTTIASLQTVLQARIDGYRNCVCAWVAEGDVGFENQQKDFDCYPISFLGTVACGFGYNKVYCKNQYL